MQPTPGLIFGLGRITNPEWSDADFNEWYNTVHIREALTITNFPKAAFRFKNQDPNAPFTYLALYPSDDIHAPFVDSAEKLTPHDDKLMPNGGNYMNLASWNVRTYEKIETLDSSQQGGRIGNQIIAVAMSPGEDVQDSWYDPKLLEMIKSQDGYIRTHGYVLAGAREADGNVSDPKTSPKYLALFEFRDTKLPPQHIEFHGPSKDRPIYQDAEEVQRDLWELIFEAGDENVGL